MNEETKQPDIEESEDNLEETATEPRVEDVLPDEPLPEELLPEEYDKPSVNVELTDDELTLEDEFPSELDLGDDEPDFETGGEMILIIASDESVTIDDDEQAIEVATDATTEAATEAIAGTTDEPEAVE